MTKRPIKEGRGSLKSWTRTVYNRLAGKAGLVGLSHYGTGLQVQWKSRKYTTPGFPRSSLKRKNRLRKRLERKKQHHRRTVNLLLPPLPTILVPPRHSAPLFCEPPPCGLCPCQNPSIPLRISAFFHAISASRHACLTSSMP